MSDDDLGHARSLAEQLRVSKENGNPPEDLEEKYDLDEEDADQEVREGVGSHSRQSPMRVDPLTPRVEVIGSTLVSDVSESVTADLVSQWDGYVSCLTRLWMDVSQFQVTSRPVYGRVVHTRQYRDDLPTSKSLAHHGYAVSSASSNHGASGTSTSSDTDSGSRPNSSRSSSVTGSPASPV